MYIHLYVTYRNLEHGDGDAPKTLPPISKTESKGSKWWETEG